MVHRLKRKSLSAEGTGATKKLLTEYFIYPYKDGSQSALALAEALRGKVIKLQDSKFRWAPWKKVINWGNSFVPGFAEGVLNHPVVVEVWKNKGLSFGSWSLLGDPPRIPEWTTDVTEAWEWLKEGCSVVQRKTLTGHSGSGIIIAEKPEDFEVVPLYTKYIKKDSEYRVHIMDGEVIDVQRKVRDPNTEPTDWRIRSHPNGFIFIREGFETPPDVLAQSQKAFGCSGLNFGAFDVIWNKKQQKAYILEVNTAPGIMGKSVEIYANAIRNHYEKQTTIN